MESLSHFYQIIFHNYFKKVIDRLFNTLTICELIEKDEAICFC